MKKIKLLLIATSILTVCAFKFINTIEWKPKADYSVKFYAGSFKGLKALILFDELNPEKSKITATIDARTLSTGNSLMDAHARDKEALDAERFTSIMFVSSSVKKTAEGYEAIGYLTIKGITKEVKLPFKFDSKNNSAKFPFVFKQTFSGILTITPKDFNITRAGVPDRIAVELNIPVTQ